MKLKLLRSLMLIAVLLTGSHAFAYDFEVDGIYYDIISTDDKTVSVTYKDTNHNSYTGDVVIPSTVTSGDATYTVTSIGGSAFYRCTGLTSVEIPSSVTSIGELAFYNCTSLTSVEIPSSVTSIGELAFYDISSLSSIDVDSENENYSSLSGVLLNEGKTELICYPAGKTESSYLIPNSVTSIGEYAFCYCSSLESITIPNSVISIGGRAFASCTGLTSVEIPSSVTSIGGSAFFRCTSLTSVEIPNSVTSIGAQAFFGCFNLTSVEIPNSVTSIENTTFYRCALTSVDIPNSVETIGDGAFMECRSLTSVVIPSSVVSIEAGAFSHCSSLEKVEVSSENNNYISLNGILFNKERTELICYPAGKTESAYTIPSIVTSIFDRAFAGCKLTSVEIPSSVTSIGEGAFSHCQKLASITIPNNVTSIEYITFSSCSSLTSVTIPNSVTSIADGAFSSCGLTSITIPRGVITIGKYAFRECDDLISVTIPSSVSLIDDYAFKNCVNLQSVYVENCTPPTALAETLSNISSDAVLYVPSEEAKSAYMTAEGWSGFSDYAVNYLKPNDIDIYVGNSAVMLVDLVNEPAITAFQCDLYFPAGITCDSVTLADRSVDHTLSSAEQADGALRVLAISFTSSPFTGNDGVLLNLKLSASSELDDQVKQVEIKNIKLTTPDEVEYTAPDQVAYVNVKTYITGDANGSGDITVTDVVSVINHVLGKSSDSFVLAAADVNNSGDVTVTDAVGTVNLVLAQSSSTASQASTMSLRSVSAKSTTQPNSLYLNDMVVVPGEEKSVSIYMDNAVAFCAFQADIHLPDGVAIKSMSLSSARNNGHFVSSSNPADGVTRIVAISLSNTDFIGESGDALVDLTLSVSEDFTGGVITIDNVELSTKEEVAYNPEATTATLSVDGTTGIGRVQEESTPIEYYNLQGLRVEDPSKGIYIKRQGSKTTKVVL